LAINELTVSGFKLDLSADDPFRGMSKKEILICLEWGIEERDIELATLALDTLEIQGRAGKAKSLLKKEGVKPIPWLKSARAGLSILEEPPKNRSNGHLYTVLVSAPRGARAKYWAYVGSTRYTPEYRFGQHRAGVNAAGIVQSSGIQILRSLCWPWRTVPGRRQERLDWEAALHECLALAVPMVKGDSHPEDWADGFQAKLASQIRT